MKLKTKGKKKNVFSILNIPFFNQSEQVFVEAAVYKRITDNGLLVDRDNHFQAYLKVRTRDLNSLNPDELQLLTSRLSNMYRMYTDTLKLVSMTHLIDISEEMRHLNRLLSKYKQLMVASTSEHERKNYHHKMVLVHEEMLEWKAEEKEVQERVFYFVVYGKTEKETFSNIDKLTRFGGSDFDLQHERDRGNIERIVFKLSNKSTLV